MPTSLFFFVIALVLSIFVSFLILYKQRKLYEENKIKVLGLDNKFNVLSSLSRLFQVKNLTLKEILDQICIAYYKESNNIALAFLFNEGNEKFQVLRYPAEFTQSENLTQLERYMVSKFDNNFAQTAQVSVTKLDDLSSIVALEESEKLFKTVISSLIFYQTKFLGLMIVYKKDDTSPSEFDLSFQKSIATFAALFITRENIDKTVSQSKQYGVTSLEW